MATRNVTTFAGPNASHIWIDDAAATYADNTTISTLTSGNSTITGGFSGIYENNDMTVNGDLTIADGGSLSVQVSGELVDVSEKLSETEMLLGIMTNLLDTLIKDNPGITSAKSIEDLMDKQKMMKKLSK
tara:strand:- start:11 stop:400 length:390 start_codon:yes stop_codon:yes gene_type:complete